MSGDTPVTSVPPPVGPVPSVLHLSAEQVPQNQGGTFTVRARFLPALLAGGWRIVVEGGTTHVP
jgi:hypothetical protein